MDAAAGTSGAAGAAEKPIAVRPFEYIVSGDLQAFLKGAFDTFDFELRSAGSFDSSRWRALNLQNITSADLCGGEAAEKYKTVIMTARLLLSAPGSVEASAKYMYSGSPQPDAFRYAATTIGALRPKYGNQPFWPEHAVKSMEAALTALEERGPK